MRKWFLKFLDSYIPDSPRPLWMTYLLIILIGRWDMVKAMRSLKRFCQKLEKKGIHIHMDQATGETYPYLIGHDSTIQRLSMDEFKIKLKENDKKKRKFWNYNS